MIKSNRHQHTKQDEQKNKKYWKITVESVLTRIYILPTLSIWIFFSKYKMNNYVFVTSAKRTLDIIFSTVFSFILLSFRLLFKFGQLSSKWNTYTSRERNSLGYRCIVWPSQINGTFKQEIILIFFLDIQFFPFLSLSVMLSVCNLTFRHITWIK